MKFNFSAIIFSILFSFINVSAIAETQWELVWNDEFSAPALDESKWTKIPPVENPPDWRKYMRDDDPTLFEHNDGNLILKGKKDSNDGTKRDYRTAGIYSLDTYNFKYGKVEVCAKFDSMPGVWPAIWMMPKSGAGWPHGGEIDIMEHLNWQGNVWQTIHYGNASGNHASSYVTPSIDKEIYNTYGVEWAPGEIKFLVNGAVTATFTPDDINGKWPYDDNEFYLILDMQIGGTWVEGPGGPGYIDNDKLYNDGANMYLDYVRVWQDASMIPEPSTFGLLAGLGALALVASRRRRSRRN